MRSCTAARKAAEAATDPEKRRELAERVIRLTGSRSRIVFNPLPADDPTQRRPSIALAQRELGWQPTIELEEGLRRTIDWYRASKFARGAASRV